MNILVEHNGSVYRLLKESIKELGVWMNRDNNVVWSASIKGDVVYVTDVRHHWEMDNVSEIRMLIDDEYKNVYVIRGNDVKFLFGTEVYAIDRKKNEYAMLYRYGQVLVRMRKVN